MARRGGELEGIFDTPFDSGKKVNMSEFYEKRKRFAAVMNKCLEDSPYLTRRSSKKHDAGTRSSLPRRSRTASRRALSGSETRLSCKQAVPGSEKWKQ